MKIKSILSLYRNARQTRASVGSQSLLRLIKVIYESCHVFICHSTQPRWALEKQNKYGIQLPPADSQLLAEAKDKKSLVQKKATNKSLKKNYTTAKNQIQFGMRQYLDGSIYNGQIKNDLRHGSGQQSYKDGSHFYGKFANDYRSGYGQFTKSNGDKYFGNYVRGRRTGFGRLLIKGSHEYKGIFLNGSFNGIGTLIVDGLIRFEGIFRNGKIGDQGKVFTKKKQILWNSKDAYQILKQLQIPDEQITYLLETFILTDKKWNY